MLVIGTDVVESYFAAHVGHRGIKVARSQYDAWLRIADAQKSNEYQLGGHAAKAKELIDQALEE